MSRGHFVVVPGRGVPVTAYSWLGEAGAQDGWTPHVVTDLYAGHDDRGGPAAYRRVEGLVAEIAAADRQAPVVVAGHSTGARVALHAALLSEVDGAVALCPIADLAEHVRRARNYLPAYYSRVTADLGRPRTDNPAYAVRSPVGWARWITVPVLLVAAAEDRVCPPYQAELLHSALPAGSRLEVVPGAGHFFECAGATTTATPVVLAEIETWLAAIGRT